MKLTSTLALALMAAALLTACADNRTTGEKWGDAAEDLGEGRGLGNAAEELQDRSTGEKIGDAMEDAGQDIQREAND